MTAYRTSFDTHEQAVAECLFLGLMAPDDGKAQAAALLAEQLAAQGGLDAEAVERCKASALERFELEAAEGNEPHPAA